MRFAATIYSEIIVYDDVLYDAFAATIPTGGVYALFVTIRHHNSAKYDVKYDAFSAIIQTRKLIIRRYEK